MMPARGKRSEKGAGGVSVPICGCAAFSAAESAWEGECSPGRVAQKSALPHRTSAVRSSSTRTAAVGAAPVPHQGGGWVGGWRTPSHPPKGSASHKHHPGPLCTVHGLKVAPGWTTSYPRPESNKLCPSNCHGPFQAPGGPGFHSTTRRAQKVIVSSQKEGRSEM